MSNLDNSSTRAELRHVPIAMTPERSKQWRIPATWAISSSRGIWRAAILPALNDESNLREPKEALTQYI